MSTEPEDLLKLQGDLLNLKHSLDPIIESAKQASHYFGVNTNALNWSNLAYGSQRLLEKASNLADRLETVLMGVPRSINDIKHCEKKADFHRKHGTF